MDRIEDNITDAHDNVKKGAVSLSGIAKNAALPMIGAGVGMAVAGPLGLFIGYKLAAVAAVGTASVGYFGGKAVQKITSPPVLMIKDSQLIEVGQHEEAIEAKEDSKKKRKTDS